MHSASNTNEFILKKTVSLMDNNRRNQLTYKHEEYLSGDRVSTENQIAKISVNGYSNTHDT